MAQSSGGPTLPKGMKRKAVGRHEFRRLEGRWLIVGEETFLGIGDGCDFGGGNVGERMGFDVIGGENGSLM